MAGLLALPQLAFWAGGSLLFLGFSTVLGILIRDALGSRALGAWILAAAFVVFLLLPATIFVLQRSGWPDDLKAIDLIMAAAAALMGIWQPAWTPAGMWHAQFGLRYFALSMAMAAVWGLSLGLADRMVFPALIGVTALAAGIAAVSSTPRTL
jgi:hypothetical protein